MTAPVLVWLREVLDEEERVALAASAERDRAPEPGGERWQWVHSGDRNPAYREGHALTDQPVDLDRWAGEEYIGLNGPDYADRVYLASVQEYPTRSVGPLPHFVIAHADEVGVAVARHITGHDPANVLAGVQADRAILAAASDALHHYECELDVDGTRKYDDGGYEDFRAVWEVWERVVLLVASRYRHRPGYRAEWAPPVT